MLLALKEKRFAKRAVKRLLDGHAAVSASRPELAGKALYKEILLRTQQVDDAHADKILRRADDSVDEWTAPGRSGLRFREVVHYVVFSQYTATGQRGTVVSLRTIVDELVPPDM